MCVDKSHGYSKWATKKSAKMARPKCSHCKWHSAQSAEEPHETKSSKSEWLFNLGSGGAARHAFTCGNCVQPVISHSADLINIERFLICCNPTRTTTKFVTRPTRHWTLQILLASILFSFIGLAAALIAYASFMDWKQIILGKMDDTQKMPHKRQCTTFQRCSSKLNVVAISFRFELYRYSKSPMDIVRTYNVERKPAQFRLPYIADQITTKSPSPINCFWIERITWVTIFKDRTLWGLLVPD